MQRSIWSPRSRKRIVPIARFKLAFPSLPSSRAIPIGRAASSPIRCARRATTFARGSLETAALERHRAARESKDPRAWEEALALHESLLAKWPGHEGNARTSFLAGEAALEVGNHSSAIDHFTAAAQDSGTLGADASWQLVAVRDAWYENARAAEAPSDSLAASLLVEIDRFTTARPNDPRCPRGVVEKSRRRPAPFSFRRCRRSVRDASQYGRPRMRARRKRSAPRRIAASNMPKPPMPILRALSKRRKLFELVVERSPSFEHGDAASVSRGFSVRARRLLVRCDPHLVGAASNVIRSPSCRAMRICKSPPHPRIRIISTKRRTPMSDSPRRFPKMPRPRRRFSKRRIFSPNPPMNRDPKLCGLATWSGFLKIPMPRSKSWAPAPSASSPVSSPAKISPAFPHWRAIGSWPSSIPTSAPPALLANVAFLEGERARKAYEAARLTQPLAPALAAKKALLETVLQEYRQCAEAAVEPWSVAGAFRIGESLVTFGEALGESERPADMSAEDLAAYEEVLETQKWEFFDRGEQAWTQLLKSANPTTEEGKKWMARTQGSALAQDRAKVLASAGARVSASWEPSHRRRQRPKPRGGNGAMDRAS